MMQALRLSVCMGDTECPIDFASRLGCRNGWDLVQDFCLSVGLSLRELQEGTATGIFALAHLGSVGHQVLAQSAFVKADDCYFFRGQRLAKNDVQFDSVRFCAACLLRDTANTEVQDVARPFRRAIWRLSGIHTCPDHCLKLVELRRGYGVHAMDFSATIRPHIHKLEQLEKNSEASNPTEFEAYLLGRLAGDSDAAPWLDRMPFDVASQVCGILGALAVHAGEAVLDDPSVLRRPALANVGFGLAKGPAHLRQALLDAHRWGEFEGPKRWRGRGTFGALYDWIYLLGIDNEYTALREMLKRSASATMGISTDRDIFADDFRVADLQRGFRRYAASRTFNG